MAKTSVVSLVGEGRCVVILFGLLKKAYDVCAGTVQQVVGVGQNVYNKFFSEEAREARREKREAKKEKAAEKAALKAAKKEAKIAARKGETPNMSAVASAMKDKFSEEEAAVMTEAVAPAFVESRQFQDE